MGRLHEFHARFPPDPPPYPPLVTDPEMVRFRARLIREEFDELMAELAALANAVSPQRTVELLRNVLKEAVDLCYVAEGTAVAFGLPYEEAFEEVHRSNMSKTPRPEGGKPLKGPGYVEADMVKLVPDIIEQEDPSHAHPPED